MDAEAPQPPSSPAAPPIAAPSAPAPARPLRPGFRRIGLWLVAGIFVTAGTMKVGDPKAFAKAIVDYHLVPETLAPAMAVLLPWWEIAAGGLALLGLWRRGALAVLMGLSTVFLAAGAITMARGLSPSCGCFALGNKVGPMTALLDLGLVILCGALLGAEGREDATAVSSTGTKT